MTGRFAFLSALLALAGAPAFATLFGSTCGVVHDPQHRPVQGATVDLHAIAADWSQSAITDASGEFCFRAVALGEYVIAVRAEGFARSEQALTIAAGAQPVLHFRLSVGSAAESVEVAAAAESIETGAATTATLISRQNIALTPGASRSNSLAMITDYVPGAYVTHDQLHVRGGHQTSWLIDGVPIPNTNIASNLGPQFDPKDVDYLEADRGGYSADLGDRTYGVFNIVPRTGFERNNQAELVLSAGNFYQTNDQFSFGSHTQRLAYYASLNGNRSDLGIQTPVPQVVHDAANGYGGFTSLIANLSPHDQLRFIAAMRRDYYQIPYDPNPNDIENNPLTGQYPSIGLRDGDHESDVLFNASWVHTFDPKVLLTISPFYHYNRANYESSSNDYNYIPGPGAPPFPDATTERRGSTYAGGQIGVDANLARNHLQAGMYSFYQSDEEFFAASFSSPFSDAEHPTGRLVAVFLDDRLRLTPWLMISAGIRPTWFSGGVNESAISPRLGVAITIPRTRATLRGFYGHYYQAPPLITASGPLVQYATANSLGFIPLHGERDEEFQFGLAVPIREWALDIDTFRTRVMNFFDHNNIGESDLFFPITTQSALIRAWELTLRSPRIAHRAQLHLAYSNQIAEGGGVVTGGLTNTGSPIQICGPGVTLCPLDHDQRNTLSAGGDVLMPWQTHASTNVNYGSGFSNAFPGAPYPGNYLPAHTTFDLSLSKEINPRCELSVTALNVANRHVELDNSVTFGGFHWNSPREIYGELKYSFHF
jgi:hypothetical protein